jgi:hypothetical protein
MATVTVAATGRCGFKRKGRNLSRAPRAVVRGVWNNGMKISLQRDSPFTMNHQCVQNIYWCPFFSHSVVLAGGFEND